MLCPTLFADPKSDPIQATLSDRTWQRRKQRMFVAMMLGALIALAGCQGEDAPADDVVEPAANKAASEVTDPAVDAFDEPATQPADPAAKADVEPTFLASLLQDADALELEAATLRREAWVLTEQAADFAEQAKQSEDRAVLDEAFAKLEAAEGVLAATQQAEADADAARVQADTVAGVGFVYGVVAQGVFAAPSQALGDLDLTFKMPALPEVPAVTALTDLAEVVDAIAITETPLPVMPSDTLSSGAFNGAFQTDHPSELAGSEWGAFDFWTAD